MATREYLEAQTALLGAFPGGLVRCGAGIHLNDGVTPTGGELLPEQLDVLRPHVLGRHVHDLGAGNGRLGAALLGLGASFVTVVDQSYSRPLRAGRLECIGAAWHEYQPREPIGLAFLSWPPYLLGAPPDVLGALPRLLAKVPMVAYLGSNFGAVCGNPELWRHLATRAVVEHVPHARNTLIVYGAPAGRIPGQGLLPEEKAALYRHVINRPRFGVTYG